MRDPHVAGARVLGVGAVDGDGGDVAVGSTRTFGWKVAWVSAGVTTVSFRWCVPAPPDHNHLDDSVRTRATTAGSKIREDATDDRPRALPPRVHRHHRSAPVGLHGAHAAPAGHEKVDFELLGTWYTMGITGRWPQVVNIWEIPGGWDGWYGKVDRLGLKRMSNADLEGWWKRSRTSYRTGGFDRLLAGRPGVPDDGVARGRRRAGLVVRARADGGPAGHRRSNTSTPSRGAGAR